MKQGAIRIGAIAAAAAVTLAGRPTGRGRAIVWDFDTRREFATVNGVEGRFGGLPGNVLLPSRSTESRFRNPPQR
jgi:hypothetical protein